MDRLDPAGGGVSLKRVSNRRTDALARTDWAEVERLLAEHYRLAGFEVDHCGTGSGASRYDGGIDLKLRRADKYIIVQCKHWNAMKVPHNDVHQLIGLMINEGATAATLVTSGEFTRAAIEAATKHGHVQLVDGDDLRAMLGALPEPNGSSEPGTTAVGSAKGVASYVGKRLLNSVEDRIRSGGQDLVTSRSMNMVARGLILKGFIGLLLPLLILLIFVSWLKHALRPGTVMPSTQAVSVPVQAPDPVEKPSVTHAQTVVGEVAPAVYVRRQPTAEEIRDQQRKAEEAIKVLEATTPELYQGRPGQVRGQ